MPFSILEFALANFTHLSMFIRYVGIYSIFDFTFFREIEKKEKKKVISVNPEKMVIPAFGMESLGKKHLLKIKCCLPSERQQFSGPLRPSFAAPWGGGEGRVLTSIKGSSNDGSHPHH